MLCSHIRNVNAQVHYIVLSTHIVTIAGRQIAVPDAHTIRSSLQHAAPPLSESQLQQIQRYIAILLLWNERLSLTTITDPSEILARHVAEAVLALPHLPTEGRLADVGSGAGFPGLSLKIFLPNLQVLLIEQNTKKATFLNEAIRFIHLGGASVAKSDYRTLPPSAGPFDVVTVRALGDYRGLLRWSLDRLTPAGKVVLWLGESDATKLAHLPNWTMQPPIKIPETRHRVLQIASASHR